MPQPLDVLKTAVTSYEPYLRPSGELVDPWLGRPTQYSTPYHALCQAVLALKGDPADREYHLCNAVSGLNAALTHVADPTLDATVSTIDRMTGQTRSINHRDFFWPPIMKIYRILRTLGAVEADQFAERIMAVDILTSFASRPPSNWAMVWLSGEWMRVKEGLSPFDRGQIDEWLAIFFAGHILLDQGLYQEPGHPNSYDLFTRYHMADILLDGYDGAWRSQLEQLLETGLRRSLLVQLSDGSLASAHRSTGQTWTLGAQCAYFTHAANYFRETGATQAEAAAAAQRAFASFARWQRPDGPYSPVENLLPPGYRIGYEGYTADGHYGNLAMGFLAVAILNDFTASTHLEQPARPPQRLIESDPTYRAIIHRGPYSLHFNAFPAPRYDSFGLVDLTFGPGRRFHFASSVRHPAGDKFFNIGLAVRQTPGFSELLPLAQQEIRLIDAIQPGPAEASLHLKARVKGSPYTYEILARIEGDSVYLEECTPHLVGYKTLLVPYLRDGGWPETTQIEIDGSTIRFKSGNEVIRLEIEAAIEHLLDLPHGFENRRGLCSLLRIDLAGPLESVRYRFTIEV